MEDSAQLAAAQKKTETIQTADAAAVSALHDTAKWIVGGVAVAAGGIIAGSTITSLGSLGLEWRLVTAIGGAAAGFTALLCLLSSAVKVLTPRTYDLHRTLIRFETIPKADLRRIEKKIEGTLPKVDIGKMAIEFDKINRAGTDNKADQKTLNELKVLLDVALSNIRFEHSLEMFEELTKRLFVVAPLMVLSFGVFAWAANPPKENAANVVPMVKEIEVNPDDALALRKAMVVPECLGSSLKVVVLREWRSGSQDVLTVPQGSCSPIRLKLDHGRLAPMS